MYSISNMYVDLDCGCNVQSSRVLCVWALGPNRDFRWDIPI